MPINFKDEQNKFTYTGRTADGAWREAMMSLIQPSGRRIADVGCGGGIYSRAWLELGAREVVGVDSSPTMISAVVENCSDLTDASFRIGDATNTGLADNSIDVVFERALIHHLADIDLCLQEAMRIIKPGGMIIIQDRTPEDIAFPGSPEHIRGYFFECFPRLSEVESGRRRTEQAVTGELTAALFQQTRSFTFWEIRKVYSSKTELWHDLRQRKGRSILHELNDAEIDSLISFVDMRLPDSFDIVEKDRWTIWIGTKP